MKNTILKMKCDLYLNSLKDMHNIAAKTHEDAENEVQKQLAKALIATVDACIDSFTHIFDLSKETIKSKNIQ